MFCVQDGRVGGRPRYCSENVLGGELLAWWLLLSQALRAEVLFNGRQGQLYWLPHWFWGHVCVVPCLMGKLCFCSSENLENNTVSTETLSSTLFDIDYDRKCFSKSKMADLNDFLKDHMAPEYWCCKLSLVITGINWHFKAYYNLEKIVNCNHI